MQTKTTETDRPIPGVTYVLFGGKPGASWAERAIKPDSLPLGARVSYGDMANQRQMAVVVEASGGGHGQQCVFVEDFHAGHVSQACIDGPGGWRREAGEAGADEIARLVAEVEPARQRRKLESETAATEHSREVARITAELREKYPWAKGADNISGHARAAANLRKELQLAFPGVKFRVRSDSFSMGNSVDYSWTLGPTSKEVEAIAGKYQYGHFDGMQDMYEHDRSAFSASVCTVLGQTKYCHGSRDEGREAHAIVARALCEYYSLPVPEGENPSWRITIPNMGEEIGCLARQIIMQQAFPAGAVVTGIERTDETCGQLREFWRVLFRDTTPTPARPAAADDAAAPAVGADGVSVNLNAEKNGVEIKFDKVPPVETRDLLKAHGFRWSRFGGCWYHKQDPASLAFAYSLAGSKPPATGEPSGADTAPGAAFACECGGEITPESETRVFHSCRRPSQSYGMDNRPIPYERTGDAAGGFRWSVAYQSAQ